MEPTTCPLIFLASLLTVSLAFAGEAPAAGERIVFIGDSLTDGFTWPMLMRQALAEAGKPAEIARSLLFIPLLQARPVSSFGAGLSCAVFA